MWIAYSLITIGTSALQPQTSSEQDWRDKRYLNSWTMFAKTSVWRKTPWSYQLVWGGGESFSRAMRMSGRGFTAPTTWICSLYKRAWARSKLCDLISDVRLSTREQGVLLYGLHSSVCLLFSITFSLIFVVIL